MNFDRADIWTKKSWMDEFTSDPRLAKDLTSIYADDVYQSMEDGDFSSLDDALAQLKDRVGLTTAEIGAVNKIVRAKLNPRLHNAEENIKMLSRADLGELIRVATTECSSCKNAPCDCSKTISKVVAEAVNSIGLDVIAEMYDTMGEAEEVATEVTPAVNAVAEGEVDLDAAVAEENTEEALAMASAAADMLKSAGELPEGLRNYLDKKKGKSTDEGESKGETHDKKDVEVEDKEDKKAEASADGCPCGNGDSCACVKTASKDEDEDEDDEHDMEGKVNEDLGKDASYTARIVAAAKKKLDQKKNKKNNKKEVKVDKKKKEDKKKKDNWNKKKMKLKDKKCAENWENFLTSKGYFQGSDAEPMDPNTSNNPEKLGYPGEVAYSNTNMQVPVGEDSRPWEQDAFEEAANETKKDFLPGGKDLELKKMWQRAKYRAFMKKYTEAKEKGLLNKEANPAEFLKKKKAIDQKLAMEQEVQVNPKLDKGGEKAAPMAAQMGTAANLKKKVMPKNS